MEIINGRKMIIKKNSIGGISSHRKSSYNWTNKKFNDKKYSLNLTKNNNYLNVNDNNFKIQR
jgi:hypothetical protein